MGELLLMVFAISGGDMLAAAGAVIAALIAVGGVIYTNRQSKKAQQATVDMENKAVDAEAYERARESYEAAIKNYLSEIARLSARLESLTAKISKKDDEVQELKKQRSDQRYDAEAMREILIEQRREYEDHLRRCERRLTRLRIRLAEGHITADDPDLQLEP